MTGAELRELRDQLGWSQVKFAKQLDIHQGTLARWEMYGPPQYGAAKIALESLVAKLRGQLRRNSRGGSARSIRDAGDGG
jgi:transcriptional regulator with XRE-family HTH domain